MKEEKNFTLELTESEFKVLYDMIGWCKGNIDNEVVNMELDGRKESMPELYKNYDKTMHTVRQIYLKVCKLDNK